MVAASDRIKKNLSRSSAKDQRVYDAPEKRGGDKPQDIVRINAADAAAPAKKECSADHDENSDAPARYAVAEVEDLPLICIYTDFTPVLRGNMEQNHGKRGKDS